MTYPDRSALFHFSFTNIWVLCSIGISWVAVSVFLSIRSGRWHWFARSGAILAIIGGVLTCRTVLRRTPEYRSAIVHMSIIQMLSPDELASLELDSKATIIGVIFLVSGSLIWAYGDVPDHLRTSNPASSAHDSTSTNDPAATRGSKTT